MKNYNYEGLVSIIMPSWNTGAFIDESIQSVINQTYTNWELIIVDDCSVDDTENIVKSYDDKRIRFFKNDYNMGAALTRNKALKEARGEWIAFLDSDDIWLPEKLEKQVNFMKENKCFFSYHNFEKIDEQSNPLRIIVTGPKIVTKKMMYNYGYPGCLTFMYNANKVGLVQIEDIKKNNDYAILLKVCKVLDCYLLDENLAKYRVRKKSISHDKFLKKIKSHYELFRRCDNRNCVTSAFLCLNNMVFGVLKKYRYENKKC